MLRKCGCVVQKAALALTGMWTLVACVSSPHRRSRHAYSARNHLSLLAQEVAQSLEMEEALSSLMRLKEGALVSIQTAAVPGGCHEKRALLATALISIPHWFERSATGCVRSLHG